MIIMFVGLESLCVRLYSSSIICSSINSSMEIVELAVIDTVLRIEGEKVIFDDVLGAGFPARDVFVASSARKRRESSRHGVVRTWQGGTN